MLEMSQWIRGLVCVNLCLQVAEVIQNICKALESKVKLTSKDTTILQCFILISIIQIFF